MSSAAHPAPHPSSRLPRSPTIRQAESLFEYTDLEAKSLLHMAAANGSVRAIEEMVALRRTLAEIRAGKEVVLKYEARSNAGADRDVEIREWLDSRDQFGRSALHFATEHGRLATIDALLEAGATLGVRTRGGETLLHFAARYDQEQTVSHLVSLAGVPGLLQFPTFAGQGGPCPCGAMNLERASEGGGEWVPMIFSACCGRAPTMWDGRKIDDIDLMSKSIDDTGAATSSGNLG